MPQRRDCPARQSSPFARIRAHTLRVGMVLLLTLVGLQALPLPEGVPASSLSATAALGARAVNAGYVVSGFVDCGRSSGLPCQVGPTVRILSDDAGDTRVHLTLEIGPKLLEQLGWVNQDDYVSFEVETDASGLLMVVAVVVGGKEGQGYKSGANDSEAPEQTIETPSVAVTPTKIPVQLPVHP